MSKLKPLTPPDTEQCQGEKPNKNTFMTMGGTPCHIKHIRCKNKPKFIVTEKKKGKDCRIGSMSLCPDCLAVAYKQLGDTFTSVSIEKG